MAQTQPSHREAPVIIMVISGKNAMQVFLMLVSIAIGVPLMLGAIPPNTVSELLPSPLPQVWGLCMVLGGFVNLIGGYWAGRVEQGVRIEMWSCLFMALSGLIYPVALVLFATALGTAWLAISYNLGFSIACAARMVQSYRSLREIQNIRQYLEGSAP